MKKTNLLMVTFLSMAFLGLHAQNEIPKGFATGQLLLADSSKLAGYIKESIHGNAAVSFIPTPGAKKKNFDGTDLLALEIDSASWLCIKGDFFRVVCKGELYFLKKESDASRKPVYNGTEPLFINGTAGKINDYFFYDRQQKQLQLLTKKNMADVVNGSFNNCTAAITKAKETGDDLAMLSQAVDIYNSRNGK